MLSKRVDAFAIREGLWSPTGTRVVAAVSGGSDSVGMLLLLSDLHAHGVVRLDVVAHLNHRIRPEADEDERFCARLAAQLGFPFVSSQADIPALAREKRRSVEVAARGARRAFLEQVRQTRGADVIATAHTQDDQVETVLLRLVRGAGKRGLGAIAPRRGRFIRPVLCLTRAELHAELGGRAQAWREDLTNRDLANPRNRVRHELLPYLERHFNPSVRAALARAASLAQADDHALDREALAAAIAIVEWRGAERRLDRVALTRLAPAVAGRVVRDAISSLSAPNRQTSAGRDHVEAVLAVARGESAAAEIPGVRVEPCGRFVVLESKDQRTPARPPFQADLSIPGEVRWEGAGLAVTAEGPFGAGAGSDAADGLTIARVAADSVGQRLVVRSRRQGDRLQPLGMTGRKKLQDLFTDRKVARRERDYVPIVTDEQGRIVWVAGHVMGEEFRVTDRTNAVIILKLRRV